MFTGLVQCVGRVRRISYARARVIEVEAPQPWHPALEAGESIAVDGVCLTVAQFDRTRFTADVLEETAARSTLGSLAPGARVNLERALRAGDRLGGHIVQGHVDGIGTLLSREARGRDFRLTFRCTRAIAAATVVKGSLAVNGVSLTVSGLGEDRVSVDIIPTTAAETNLGALKPGDAVNLESDVLGRYARRQAEMPSPEAAPPPSSLTFEMLAENGFM